MTEGTISSWQLKEGDEIGAGTVMCEIETDKATVDFEAQDDGFLAKILIGTNKTVEVGKTIGIMVEDASLISKFVDFTLKDEPQPTKDLPKEEPVKVVETKVEPVSVTKEVVKPIVEVSKPLVVNVVEPLEVVEERKENLILMKMLKKSQEKYEDKYVRTL